MSNKLFVAQLSFDTTNQNLQELFAPYGTVLSARVITDRSTNRSKGFGFVEMETAEQAKAAIEALDGKGFEGRNIAVSVARPQTSAPQQDRYKGNDNHRGNRRR
jgi:RNA recognition motif-containing protein